VDSTNLLRVVALFFGSYLVFALVRKATEGSPALVTLVAQVAALGVIVGGIVLVVRRQGRD
jgi:hypothetical protein